MRRLKTYCLASLLYDCEVWHLTDTNMHKISVAWNNCFRRIFFHVAGGRVSNHYNIFALRSQYRISFSSANCFFWKKIYWSDNIVLLTLSRLTYNALLLLVVLSVCCAHNKAVRQCSQRTCVELICCITGTVVTVFSVCTL